MAKEKRREVLKGLEANKNKGKRKDKKEERKDNHSLLPSRAALAKRPKSAHEGRKRKGLGLARLKDSTTRKMGSLASS